MKFFNTSGPIQPDIHDCLPPLSRMDKDHILLLIAQRKYFVLHAPRQTGKTSCMKALIEELNQSGKFHALYINVESAQAAREDVAAAMRSILNQIAVQARFTLKDEFPRQRMEAVLATAGAFEALFTILHEWSEAAPRPIVLVIDEIDALICDTLVSVLRQLRTGYADRPAGFPQSIILCGVRDVRDYRMEGEKQLVAGGSAFNIKDESLRLGNFSVEEIEALYRQHTAETGQQFDDGVWLPIWELTGGQPWLVNALAYEACFRQPEGKDRARPVTVELIWRSKEALILRRDTHLRKLVETLGEERVRRVIEPMLAGEINGDQIPADDIQYALDLGLIRRGSNGLEIANAIYREVVPRTLTFTQQIKIESIQQPAWYITPDGRLDMKKTAGGISAIFPRAFRKLARPLRVQRGRAATAAASLPATDRERRRRHPARIRAGPQTHRPAHHLAARGGRAAHRAGIETRPRHARQGDRRGTAANRGLRRSMQCR
jgi:AAA-like domain